MMPYWLLIFGCSFALAAVVTKLVIKSAHHIFLIDIPVERSLHSTPTPRGGGLGIVVGSAAAIIWAIAVFKIQGPLLSLFTGLATGIALLGSFDDRYSLAAGVRLVTQLTLSALAVAVYFWLRPDLTSGDLAACVLLAAFFILFLTWMTNLYNFMDGSDGLAAVQGLTTALGFTLLSQLDQASIVSLALAGACLGFLIFNWAPAKIFMGDVGSLYIGFFSGLLILTGCYSGKVFFIAALILHGSFAVDATITLITRLLRKKKPHVAHKSHTYQRWIQQGKSHKFVAFAYAAANLFWLLPLAYFANQQVSIATQVLIALIAWAPLVFIAVRAKAGFD